MSNKYTEDEIMTKVSDMTNGKWEFIRFADGNTDGASNKVRVICRITACGHKRELQLGTIRKLTDYDHCIQCNKEKAQNKEKVQHIRIKPKQNPAVSETEFMKRASANMTNRIVEVLDYTNTSNPATVKLECGHTITCTARSFLYKGIKCPKCKLHATRMKNIERAGMIVLSDDESTEEITLQCRNDDAHIFTRTYAEISNSRCTCLQCAEKKKLDNSGNFEIFKKRLIETFNDTYRISETDPQGKPNVFVNMVTPIWFLCTECNTKFKAVPYEFMRGNKTHLCEGQKWESKGILKIKEYLESESIPYRQEVKFRDMPQLRSQPYRFDIMAEVNGQECIIEYDGKQHFSYTEHYCGDTDYFRYRCQVDDLKTVYCEQKKIPLLRIGYWQNGSISKILSDFLQNPDGYVSRHNPMMDTTEYYKERAEQMVLLGMS